MFAINSMNIAKIITLDSNMKPIKGDNQKSVPYLLVGLRQSKECSLSIGGVGVNGGVNFSASKLGRWHKFLFKPSEGNQIVSAQIFESHLMQQNSPGRDCSWFDITRRADFSE